MSKIRISFSIPKTMQQELREQIIKDGYGLRGKSNWIVNSIKNLLNLKNFIEYVHYTEDMGSSDAVEMNMGNSDVIETISVDRAIKKMLDDAIYKVRSAYPMIEGVQSRIVRASIMQQLLRS